MKIVDGSAVVVGGVLYEITGEDGLLIVCDYYIHVDACDGYTYELDTILKGWGVDEEGIPGVDYGSYDTAVSLTEKINAKGEINLAYWHVVEEKPSYALGEVDEASLMDEEERIRKGV